MSINSLANAAAARRPDLVPLGAVPQGLDQIARGAMTPPTDLAPGGAPGGAPPPTPVDTTFNVLFGHIPTEILTLYVAVLAAVQEAGKVTPVDWAVFWTFLMATPIVVWLVFGAKLKTAGKPLPISYGSWPIWEMFAATFAYVAWAFALPNSPFTAYTWCSSALSGLGVLIASTALGLLSPFFQKPLTH